MCSVLACVMCTFFSLQCQLLLHPFYQVRVRELEFSQQCAAMVLQRRRHCVLDTGLGWHTGLNAGDVLAKATYPFFQFIDHIEPGRELFEIKRELGLSFS